MLVPKRVKHRREFRGKMRGEAKGGKEVAFGEYGLQAVDSHWNDYFLRTAFQLRPFADSDGKYP